ncbi:hypothetical protein HYU92_04105 [Candidatus Curtissbacteria bacterium]|nr:hypothetical protein [Candidatus Curtissbacteria bacterium]
MKRKRIANMAKYANEWVAIDRSKSRVIAHGSSFNKLWNELKQKAKKATFYKVPPADTAYSP